MIGYPVGAKIANSAENKRPNGSGAKQSRTGFNAEQRPCCESDLGACNRPSPSTGLSRQLGPDRTEGVLID